MSRPAAEVAEKVANEAQRTARYLGRIQAAHGSGPLHADDVLRAFEGAYLNFYTTVEEQLEYLFYGLLMERLRVSGSKPRIAISSERVAKDLVLAGRDYADWLPINRTIARAEVFLTGGRPFSSFDGGARSTFKEMKIVRDAIAHSGSHARRTFQDKVAHQYTLAPRERNPAGFLASIHAGSRTRMENLISRSAQAFGTICG